jgi:phosphoribosylanthranilate isomerase
MQTTKVKICGITTLDDALAAIELGADLLGFNFYPASPRYIEPGECAGIIAGLWRASRSTVLTVGVFVNAPLSQVQVIAECCGLDLIQLSGDEPPEMLQALGQKAVKVLRPASPESLQATLQRYPARTSAPTWLIDTFVPGQFGGTGINADWEQVSSLARRAPILLAGGLRPENVAAALAQVRPWGVDVASGVETAPGRKDRVKMAEFIDITHAFHQEDLTVED